MASLPQDLGVHQTGHSHTHTHGFLLRKALCSRHRLEQPVQIIGFFLLGVTRLARRIGQTLGWTTAPAALHRKTKVVLLTIESVLTSIPLWNMKQNLHEDLLEIPTGLGVQKNLYECSSGSILMDKPLHQQAFIIVYSHVGLTH